ncbi:MAG TPA: 50S ribosomal protein L11 methyltransferase, partial [Caulobacteraceae bacterium]|nr:50S ribosomal protein L11 methyltransferase [Caulobacteraceae bacterium]
EVQAFVRANLPPGPVPTVPEIRLHRAGAASGLRRLAEADEAFGAPYWAYDWGGGLALARHVLDNPGVVADRRVLDLGCGSGLVGIAAMKAGARSVLAADTDPYAIAAAPLNAALNGVAVETALRDVTGGGAPPDIDLVLVGDLFYDEALARRVTRFLELCVAAGTAVLVGDPGRAFLPHDRLQAIADYPGPDFATRGGRNTVFAFA